MFAADAIMEAVQSNIKTIVAITEGIPTADMIKMESSRLQRADTVIAIISNTVEHSKIPEWEQILSCGAVCTTILYAAQSLGYAAQWVTEWYAYNEKMLTTLGGIVGKDKIAGFIYIGNKIEEESTKLSTKGISKDVKFSCEECNNVTETSIVLDPVNFFTAS